MGGETKERRSARYSFQSREHLMAFFSQWLEEPVILQVVEQMKKNFIERSGSAQEETRLQYLKKCQFALMELLSTEIEIL